MSARPHYGMGAHRPRSLPPQQTVGNLRPAEYNPRKISNDSLKRLGDSMRRFGDLGGIVRNLISNHLVGGHQRLQHFKSDWPIRIEERFNPPDAVGSVARGYIETPFGKWSYREVRWDDNTERSANIAANAHGGEFDMRALDSVVKGLSTAGADLDILGLDPHKTEMFSGMLSSISEDEAPEKPRIAITKPGDIWEMGAHRLLCGDATQAASYDRLMGGGTERARMIFTDPPWNVAIVGKFHGQKGRSHPII
jgi:hypothetical protein